MSAIAWLTPYQGKGEQNGRSKLAEDQVRRIRQRNANGAYAEKALALSVDMGVCETTIRLIRQRKRWGHVE